MFQGDMSSCSSYDYGDALYWDARYLEEGGASFDWYQLYSALRPLVRTFVPTSSRVLMVGCGNAVMSEDMVKDGYEEIMNIDISSVVIDMMRKKHAHVPQLKYMQMDVRDMSFFPDDSFDNVIDKGTLDSLMCGINAPISASQMLGEVNRLLKPGGNFMLITYGDPSVRVPRLNQEGCSWKITLYIIRYFLNPRYQYSDNVHNDPEVRACTLDVIRRLARTVDDRIEAEREMEPYRLRLGTYGEREMQDAIMRLSPARPGYKSPKGSSSPIKSNMEPVALTEGGLLPAGFVLEDPDSHYIYVCKKLQGLANLAPANLEQTMDNYVMVEPPQRSK